MTTVSIRRSQSAVPARLRTEQEQQVRIDLAACYRLIALSEMDDLHATHISARVPGDHEHFLINPYGLLFSQVTASNLVKVDINGEIVEESPYTINPAGFVIHSAIHAARADAFCVIHTHTIAGIAVACLEEGILPISQKAMHVYGRVSYHDYEGKADELDERERLVRDLGRNNALVLRNHGLLACGPTIGQAYKLMMNFEKACKIQLAAMASGGTLVRLSQNVIERASRQMDRDRTPSESRPDGWPSLLAMLDKVDPGYKA
jgi:ribulose-5-phosphate 4-epimerase/fuculose-1-phosphate aldolase